MTAALIGGAALPKRAECMEEETADEGVASAATAVAGGDEEDEEEEEEKGGEDGLLVSCDDGPDDPVLLFLADQGMLMTVPVHTAKDHTAVAIPGAACVAWAAGPSTQKMARLFVSLTQCAVGLLMVVVSEPSLCSLSQRTRCVQFDRPPRLLPSCTGHAPR